MPQQHVTATFSCVCVQVVFLFHLMSLCATCPFNMSYRMSVPQWRNILLSQKPTLLYPETVDEEPLCRYATVNSYLFILFILLVLFYGLQCNQVCRLLHLDEKKEMN